MNGQIHILLCDAASALSRSFLAPFFPFICKILPGHPEEGRAQGHTVGGAPRALASGVP